MFPFDDVIMVQTELANRGLFSRLIHPYMKFAFTWLDDQSVPIGKFHSCQTRGLFLIISDWAVVTITSQGSNVDLFTIKTMVTLPLMQCIFDILNASPPSIHVGCGARSRYLGEG